MRRLIWLTVTLMALYGGYWVLGAQAVERGAQAALAAARADGRADAAAVDLAGFPSRFDLTVTEPRLQSRDGMLAWSAPVAQILALSYRPQEVILYAPPQQSLRLGRQIFALINEDMRASAAVRIGSDLALDRATAVLAAPRLQPQGDGPALAARELRAALRAGDGPAYDLGVELLDLDLPPAILTNGRLPARIARLHLDAALGLTAPLDRHALARPPMLSTLTLRSGTLDWGGMVLTADGTLEITATGQPEGRILLRTRDWQKAIELAAETGLLPPERLPMLLLIGGQMASQSADGALELPLIFRQGQMALGPMPLGPAPYLR